jgi:hypothetical protein
MLYYLNPKAPRELRPLRSSQLAAHGWQEKDLENLVADNIDHFVAGNQLFVIAQSVVMREMPDIMALDRDGGLHLFELKRWRSNEENLLQVLRYGQKFGRSEYGDLDGMFARYQRKNGRDTAIPLREAHAQYFEREAPLAPEQFNHEQHFVVMTDGLDRATREAIGYWGRKQLDIRTLLYRIYETDHHELLLEIDAYSPVAGDDVEASVAEGLAVVNTNATYMPDAWKDMITAGKASAYYRRKTSIDDIVKGSPIALYHTGLGFVAVGKTRGTVQCAAVDGDEDEEHYVPCAFDRVVDVVKEPQKAVKAWEVNQHLGASHRLRQTVYTLPKQAFEFLKRRLEENGAPVPSRK